MTYASTLPIALTKNEVRNGSQIILTIYNAQDGFVYSINCKLGRFVRSYYPTPKDKRQKSTLDAQAAAVATIKSWIAHSREAKERLAQFDLVNYRQQELFDGL